MTAWRRVALDFLPELRDRIEHADSPMRLWGDILLRFEDAFRAGNGDLTSRFFRYAEWSLATAQREPTDASTAAWCAFYEHLPRVSGLAGELHRFLPRHQFLRVQRAFRHHLTEAEFARFCDAYLANAKSA
jgi:hypothetical protein